MFSFSTPSYGLEMDKPRQLYCAVFFGLMYDEAKIVVGALFKAFGPDTLYDAPVCTRFIFVARLPVVTTVTDNCNGRIFPVFAGLFIDVLLAG
jgi:hypothetical protein